MKNMANDEEKHGPIDSPSPTIDAVLSTIDEWSLDIFKLTNVTGGQPLKYLAYYLFNRHGIIQKFKIDLATLDKFLKKIENGSNRNSSQLQNAHHAADVAQTMHYMLSQTGLTSWTSHLEKFACLFAAVVHVYEHPGTTNNFQIVTDSEIALIYNDRLVNENYVTSMVFRLLEDEDYNIFSKLSHKEYHAMRGLVIDLILSSNLTYHFQQLKQMQKVLSWKRPKLKKEEALGLMMHCSDLSHAAKDWALHYRWSLLAFEQAFNQGDKERELGLPISPICDRNTTVMADAQIGFIEFIVKPSFQVLTDMLEFILNISETSNRENASKPWFQCMEDNKNKWKTQFLCENSTLDRLQEDTAREKV